MAKSKEGDLDATTAFSRKKEMILQQLSLPSDSYDDLSPKGSIDAEIREFVDEINSYEGLVTTSSCSGRVSVFLEGRKSDVTGEVLNGDYGNQPQENGQPYASMGGKGGGGHWLFVSHNPVPDLSGQVDDTTHTSHRSFTELFNMQLSSNKVQPVLNPSTHRLIHFKFEPMILHILASDPKTAQRVLCAATQSGFRESGASSLPTTTSSANLPVPLAIRSTGIAFDNIIGFCSSSTSNSMLEKDNCESIVQESYIRSLMLIANEKFHINKSRTERFRALLAKEFGPYFVATNEWEDATERKKRKRAEGLRKKEELRNGSRQIAENHESTDVNCLDENYAQIMTLGVEVPTMSGTI